MNIDDKEYIQLIVKKETDVILERLRGMDIETKKDAMELARRLEDLNHAHAKAEQDRHMYVEKIAFDPWKEGIIATLAEMKGRWAVIAGVAALIASLVVVIARSWFSQ